MMAYTHDRPNAAGTPIIHTVALVGRYAHRYLHWARPVLVTLRLRAGAFDVVGIERPTELLRETE